MPPVTSDYLAIRQSRKRSRPNARGFRSRSMLPWEAWVGVRLAGRHGRSEAGGHNNLGTRRASTCRAFPTLQGTSRGLSMPSLPVWVHVFPSNKAGWRLLDKKLGDGLLITRTRRHAVALRPGRCCRLTGLAGDRQTSQPCQPSQQRLELGHTACVIHRVRYVVVVNHSPSYVLLQTISCYHPVP